MGNLTLLKRQSPTELQIQHKHPIKLFASEDVPIERQGVEQIAQFANLADDLKRIQEAQRRGQIQPYWDDHTPGQLQRIVLTPDFHKGSSGIPVGTVALTQHALIPQAVGNDVCCGMRLLATSLTKSDLRALADRLPQVLRGIFFEGKRHIALSPTQRRAILREGLIGLHDTHKENLSQGIWQHYHPDEQLRDIEYVHQMGSLPTNDCFAFEDYIRGSGQQTGYDAQMGSIGGGNHFVELQTVEDLFDGATAHAWGLSKAQVVVMIHTGSVGLGHKVGKHFTACARANYPQQLKRPAHGFYVLPTTGPHKALATQYLSAMHNAANFAFANRLFLGLMVLRALREASAKAVDARLIYDAPHNLIWSKGDDQYIHRKGACPAYGPSSQTVAPLSYTGAPVIIPGSMGASSYLMAGRGNTHALCSACHGAGRAITRSQARHLSEARFEREVAPLRVITPIDPNAHHIKRRSDILAQHRDRLAEESPHAYKPITPIIETVEEANIAHRVARLWPWMTIKG